MTPPRSPPPRTTPRWWSEAGGVVTVVESFPENLKVTRESDLRIAEALLAH